MARFARLLVAAALTLAVAAPASTAHAQATLTPLFTVAGVVNTGSFGTFIACTNTDTVSISVGIDFFAQAGNQLINAAANAVSLSPHASILFGTQISAALSVDAIVNPGSVTKGSIVVETTSKKIVCSASLVDPSTNPPISMTTLTMAYKGKQKGD